MTDKKKRFIHDNENCQFFEEQKNVDEDDGAECVPCLWCKVLNIEAKVDMIWEMMKQLNGDKK